MTPYRTAQEAIGGDPANLRGIADALEDISRLTGDLANEASNALVSASRHWRGSACRAFRAKATRSVTSLFALSSPLVAAAHAYRTLARDIENAQGDADAAMRHSVRLGLEPGDLTARPARVAAFLLNNPKHIGTVSSLLGEIVSSRLSADQARDTFIASMRKLGAMFTAAAGGDPELLDRIRAFVARVTKPEPRPRSQREPAPRFADWAGRAIVEHYLRGGGDVQLNDSKIWTPYLKANAQLSRVLREELKKQAQESLRHYQTTHVAHRDLWIEFSANIDGSPNGSGYQYLGQSEHVHFRGKTRVTPQPGGTYKVSLIGNYTWSDRIDPTSLYGNATSQLIADEVLTLGRADPYNIQIIWPGNTTATLRDPEDDPTIEGYTSE